ncbi:MAG: methyltransferase domain-containing protein [Promethearchaeota archaeon]
MNCIIHTIANLLESKLIMRGLIRSFVKLCAQTLPISEPIYEFGSFQLPGQVGFADLRPLFPGKEYIGADIRNGPGVDIILDLQKLDLLSDSVGTILILDTIEHVEFPRKAIEETYRVLKPQGVLIISSVMNFPIHEYPNDYWRFTPEGFKSLLNPYDVVFVDIIGNKNFPETILGIGFKGTISETFIQNLKKRFFYWKTSIEGESWKQIVKQFIPPKFLPILRKFRKMN